MVDDHMIARSIVQKCSFHLKIGENLTNNRQLFGDDIYINVRLNNFRKNLSEQFNTKLVLHSNSNKSNFLLEE